MLVELDHGRVLSVEARALDVVRWAVCQVDATGAADADEVVDRVREALEREVEQAEDRLLAARVVVSGRAGAHRALVDGLERFAYDVRSVAQDVGPVWIERIELSTQPLLDLDALKLLDGPIGELVRSLDALAADGEALASLAHELADLTAKLPPELRKRENGILLDDPAHLRDVLGEVKSLVLPRLIAEDGQLSGSS